MLDVNFDFDERGRIVKVNWSDGTYDVWSYHEMTKQEDKLFKLGKLSKAVVNRIGKENLRICSDGRKFKMIYDSAGIFQCEEQLT